MDTLTHLTLLSGHSRSSPRHEVHDDTIRMLLPIIQAGGGNIAYTGWSVSMINGPAPGSGAFTLHHAGVWLLSCYVAWTEPGADAMWPVVIREAQQTVLLAGQDQATRPATVPWLAVLMMPALALGRVSPSVIMETGDLERCIAWTVIEHLHT